MSLPYAQKIDYLILLYNIFTVYTTNQYDFLEKYILALVTFPAGYGWLLQISIT